MKIVEARRVAALSAALLAAPAALALSGTGYSTYPLRAAERFIGIEATGVTSDGGGFGLQARYTQKASRRALVDAGLGTSGGERAGRVFVNGEYEIYPDYMRQPRLALRVGYENSDEFGVRRNLLHAAPLLSKGFSAWGREFFPFLSVPMGLSLEGDTGTYRSFANISAGLTGRLPFKDYDHLIATVEGTASYSNSYSGLFVGLSYPLR